MRSEDDFSAIQDTDDKKEVVDMVGDGGSASCDNWVATLRSATVGLVLIEWFMVDKISKGRVEKKKERKKQRNKKKKLGW
jgi:p-aminobenzoyl-glutamate transporter AbgT